MFLLLFLLTNASLVLESLALLKPEFGLVGVVLWGVLLLGLTVWAWLSLLQLAQLSLKKKMPFTLSIVLIFLSGILWWSGDSRTLSGETTQETNCLINHLKMSPDKGFQQTCLFGYPARQYLPQAASTLFLGRSLRALSIGGSLYVFIGLTIFAQALFMLLGSNKRADIYTALTLSFLPHFYYVNHFMFHFEQSIFPFAFSLLLSGLVLRYLQSKQLVLLPLIALVAHITIHSYTTSLALIALLILGTLIAIVKSKHATRLTLIWLVVVVMLSVLMSFLYRNDISFGDATQRTVQQRGTDVFQMHQHLLLGNHGQAFVSPLIHGFVLCVFIALLLGRFGKKVTLVAWWAYAVLVVSVLAKGYSFYNIDFRLHRSIIIIPPLLVVSVLSLKQFLHKISAKALIVLLTISVVSGALFSVNQIATRPKHTHFEVIRLLSRINVPKKIPLVISANAAQTNGLVSLHDTGQYFLPQFDIRNATSTEIIIRNCDSLDATNAWLFADELSSECKQLLKTKGRLLYLKIKYSDSNYFFFLPAAD